MKTDTDNETQHKSQENSLTFEEGADLILKQMAESSSDCEVYERLMSVTLIYLMRYPSAMEGDRIEKAFEVARELRRIHFPVCQMPKTDRKQHDFVP